MLSTGCRCLSNGDILLCQHELLLSVFKSDELLGLASACIGRRDRSEGTWLQTSFEIGRKKTSALLKD